MARYSALALCDSFSLSDVGSVFNDSLMPASLFDDSDSSQPARQRLHGLTHVLKGIL